MDYGAVYDLLASRYSWLSLERFGRLTAANVYFLIDSAIKGKRNQQEFEAAIHGAKLPKNQTNAAPALSEKRKEELDKLALDQLQMLREQAKQRG